MDYQVVSTSDTKEQVQAAQNGASAALKSDAATDSATADKTAVENSADSEAATETDESASADGASESEVKTEGEELPEQAAEDSKKKSRSGLRRLREKISAKDQEIGYLQAQLERSRVAGTEKTETAGSSQANKASVEGKPNRDAYETHDEYVEALTDWKVDSRLKAEKIAAAESNAKTQHLTKAEKHVARVQEFAKAHSDFREIVESLDDGPKVSLTVQEVILDSDNGPELMYQLAKNRKEFERINALPAIQAARELGKFEARFAKPSEETKQTKTTKAPPPVKPIGSKASVSTKDPGSMDFDEYKKWRAAGGGA